MFHWCDFLEMLLKVIGWYWFWCLIRGIQEVAHWANWEWHATTAAELGFLLINLQLKHIEIPLAAHPLSFSPSLSQDLCYPSAFVMKSQSCNYFSLLVGPNWYCWGHFPENWYPLKTHAFHNTHTQLCPTPAVLSLPLGRLFPLRINEYGFTVRQN